MPQVYRERKEGRERIERARSEQWERCNRCGYYFQKKESGDVDGQDVIRHKREECANNR